MKRWMIVAGSLALCAVMVSTAAAQDRGRRGGRTRVRDAATVRDGETGGPQEGPRGHRPPPPPPGPLMAALDTDGDGQLSAVEVALATESLLALDANGDGAVTRDELPPPPPPPGEGDEGDLPMPPPPPGEDR